MDKREAKRRVWEWIEGELNMAMPGDVFLEFARLSAADKDRVEHAIGQVQLQLERMAEPR